MRRYPDTITRRRTRPGMRDSTGVWIPGAVDEEEFSASVQPGALKRVQNIEGVAIEGMLRCYIPQAGALEPRRSSADADIVIYDGGEYLVEKVEFWPNHTAAEMTFQGAA